VGKELPSLAAPPPEPSMLAAARPAPTPPKTAAPVAPPSGAVALGAPAASTQGSGPVTVQASDFPFAWYLHAVQRKITEKWAPPTRGDGRALVVFEISRNGEVKRTALEGSSGDAVYDQAALRAIADATPFPPLPEQYKSSILKIHLGLIRRGGVLLGLLALILALALLGPPRRTAAQGGAEVWLNVQKGGGTKLNIAVPVFTVVRGADAGVGRVLAEVTGNDLTYTGLFSVVAGTAALPADNPAALRQALTDFAAAGAHAALQGRVTISRDRAEAEMRLYDLTSPDQRVIAQKKFEVVPAQVRRLAHKVADDVMLEFTGVLGAADTRLAFIGVSAGRPGKQLYMIDYDGVGLTPLTENGSINLSPAWSPDTRSIAFTSYLKGYPDIYRLFPFERRPLQTVAAFLGINASPAWSPDGRSLALTMSKDGNAEIYVISIATGAVRRLTWNLGIDAEPT
jgi:TonB family protein